MLECARCRHSPEAFDAIVVGSGISGGWAAKELTERGLRVLLLERGKNVEHVKDYTIARKAPWEYPHRGGRTRELVDAYPVLKRDYPLNEKKPDWWTDERESPYTEIKRFDWYRGYQVGGRSLTWGRQSYRHSDIDFEANATRGHRRRLADPLRRHRAVVRPRRTSRRHLRVDRRAAAAARRPVPAGHAAQRRRGGDRRPAGAPVRGHAADHPGPHGQPHAAARHARPLSVPQRLPRSGVPTAPTSARSRRRCRRRWPPAASRSRFTPSSPTWSTTRIASAPPACA